jgi:hypothetical protein
MAGAVSEQFLRNFNIVTHPRDAAKHVPHVGEQDTPNQGESDQSRPCGDVQLDVEDDGEARQERGEEVGSLRRRCSLCRSVLMRLSRVAEDQVDDRLGGRPRVSLRSRACMREEALTTKIFHTQYTLNSQPTSSHSRPLKVRPISRIAFLRRNRETSCDICRSIFSIAATSISTLLRCKAAGFELVHFERKERDEAESASRAADPCARASDLYRC